MLLNKLKNKDNLDILRQNLSGARILILGFGREGKDTLKFLKKLFPKKVIGVADREEKMKNEKLKNAKWHLGKDYLKALKNYDIVIKSPGIPFKILLKTVLKKITSQTEIFFENCPSIIIGVGGTKGKSTTASLIYKILKACPERIQRVYLVGNIGKPVLSLLFNAKPNDIYVYELSSFQLMNLKKSPQVAVLLNSYPDHLDWHKNFNEYLQANANITRYQTEKDFLIYNSQDKLIKKIVKKSKAKKIPISAVKNIVSRELNAIAAKKTGEIFEIPDKKIVKAIKEFKPLPHRLELVGTLKGITFYNDSLSVIPETTIGALDFLGDRVQTLILGGFDRGLSFNDLARKIVFSNIKTLILFPTTGQQIWQVLQQVQGKKLPKPFFINNMPEAVKLAYENTQKGKICLLSPASPSFGIFKNYAEKGNLFRKYVKKIGNKKEKK